MRPTSSNRLCKNNEVYRSEYLVPQPGFKPVISWIYVSLDSYRCTSLLGCVYCGNILEELICGNGGGGGIVKKRNL
jgi:hypothetical protein